VTAIFARNAAPNSASGKPVRKAVATLSRLTVRGHGRARTAVLRLGTSAAAHVWATLARRGRSTADRHWRVAAGSHVLRWRIPRRARPGRYRMSIAVRLVGGASTGFIRDIRLPR
jgi:hypothetical protein